jgi:hypothetical protein
VAQNPLRIHVDIIEQNYCIDNSNILVYDQKTKELIRNSVRNDLLKVKLRLSLFNIGSEPLIIQKDHFISSRTIIAEDLKSYKEGNFIHDVSGFVSRQFFTVKDDSPPHKQFAIVKSNDFFSKEIVSYINLNDLSKSNDSYYMASLIHIWGGQYTEGEKLRKKWKNYGYLLFEPIFIGPIQINTKNPTTMLSCN